MNAAMLCIARRTADESTSHRPTANDPQADDEGAAEVVFALCSCNYDCETAALVRALSLGCPPARTQALFQHRPPSASLAPYEATRPFLSLSPTLLCTPLAEGGRKRKGGWNERKRLAPFASLALHPRPPKARASRRRKRGKEAATATVSSVAMPGPLPPSSSSPNWREFLCFHNGGRARPARLPAPLPPSLPTPETQAASRAHTALRFPQSLRAWADAGARLLLLSIVTASSFHPRSLPLILCRRREHSGGGRHCGAESDDGRGRPLLHLLSTILCMSGYCYLVSPLPPRSSLLLFRTPCPFSPGLASLARGPLVVTRSACTHSLPRDDKRRSGSLPLSHLISVFPREERVEEAVRTGQATRNKDRGNQIGTKAKGTIARTFDFAS